MLQAPQNNLWLYIAFAIALIPLSIAIGLILWLDILKPIWYLCRHLTGWFFEKEDS